MQNFIPIQTIRDQISLVAFLSKLGHEPVNKQGREKRYLSMIRESDTDPSFSVDDENGIWYDHGSRLGGDIIDLAVLYWKNLPFKEVLQKIMDVYQLTVSPVIPLPTERQQRPRIKTVRVPHYKILDVKPLGTNQAITDYLRGRGVWNIDNARLREVYYYVEDNKKVRKNYFAVGWQNILGAWEIRNKYFKGSLGKKSLTQIPGSPKCLVLFEGYMNYLSWLRYHPGSLQTVIVLNSLVNLPAAVELARYFEEITLFFDHDPSGKSATAEFIAALPHAVDGSKEYNSFNDYNEKLVNELGKFGMLPQQQRNGDSRPPGS
ncbi:MAG: hypothetical protein EOO90_06365 [Pedobacter sp.]|nr:MAG: hypothetical protein EOO90_06365 [Pedobacter sp.]